MKHSRRNVQRIDIFILFHLLLFHKNKTCLDNVSLIFLTNVRELNFTLLKELKIQVVFTKIKFYCLFFYVIFFSLRTFLVSWKKCPKFNCFKTMLCFESIRFLLRNLIVIVGQKVVQTLIYSRLSGPILYAVSLTRGVNSRNKQITSVTSWSESTCLCWQFAWQKEAVKSFL